MEKCRKTGIRFDTDALKQEASETGKQLANRCMAGAKDAAVDVANSFVQKLFDFLIDWMNAKFSAERRGGHTPSLIV